jgi:surface antigen
MRSKLILPLIAATLALGACEGAGEKQQGGTLLGAVGGALLGAQIGDGKGQLAAVAAGTLLGALIGGEVGKTLDEVDRLRAQQAVEQAHTAPINETIAWNNPETGNAGTVTATRDGTNPVTGAYCREYQTTVTIGGKTEEAYGTACRQPDGSWKILD